MLCLMSSKIVGWLLLAQAEFTYNLMSNQSMCKSPFIVIYNKAPNHTIDVAILPKCSNTKATNFVSNFRMSLRRPKSDCWIVTLSINLPHIAINSLRNLRWANMWWFSCTRSASHWDIILNSAHTKWDFFPSKEKSIIMLTSLSCLHILRLLQLSML